MAVLSIRRPRLERFQETEAGAWEFEQVFLGEVEYTQNIDYVATGLRELLEYMAFVKQSPDNEYARRGEDSDYHRGDSAYDRYYGDPSHGPNPCLGTIEKGPFFAVEFWPGDLGTKGDSSPTSAPASSGRTGPGSRGSTPPATTRHPSWATRIQGRVPRSDRQPPSGTSR